MSASAKVKESTLWKWLKSAERQSRDHSIPVTLRRVENALGMSSPDVLAWIGDVLIEIELKSCARPAREGTPIRVRFQPGQASLLHRLYNKHQSAFLLLQIGSGARARRLIFAGCHAHDVESGVTEAQLMEYASNPQFAIAVGGGIDVAQDVTAFGALAACLSCRWR